MSLQAVFEELVELPPEQRGERLRALSLTDHERQRLESMLEHATDRTKLLDLPIGNLIEHLRADDVMFARLAGGMVGPFRVLDLIGEGGSAAVFRASRPAGSGEQLVALKVLRASRFSADAERRFRREQAILAQLTHPNVARLIEGGVDSSGYPYIAMELVEGEPITRAAAARRLGVKERLEWMLCLCRAIEAAHLALIVHCDLKPSNILVDREGVIKVLDFGVARLIDASREDQPTRTIALTPEYAAPEQFQLGPPRISVDVYALGVVLGELLTGQMLGAAVGKPLSAAVLEADAPAPPDGLPRADMLARRVSGDLDAIFALATEADAANRYASAAALGDDIERYLTGRPVLARSPTRRYRVRKFVRRHRVAVATTSLVLLALVTGLGVAWWQAVVAQQAARDARAQAARANSMRNLVFDVFAEAEPGNPRAAEATVTEAAEHAISTLFDDRGADPQTRLELLARFADTVGRQGHPDRAQALLARALEDSGKSLGADDPLTRAIEERVASYEIQRGSYDAARARLDRLLAQVPPAASELRVKLLRSSASVAWHTHDRERALRDGKQAVEMSRRLDDAELERQSLTYYGAVLLGVNAVPEAVDVYNQLREINIAKFGPNHEQVALAYSGLARAYRRIGNLDKAEESSRRALAIDQAIYPNDHWITANHLNALTMVLVQKRDFDAALATARESRRIVDNTLDDSHIDRIHHSSQVGAILMLSEHYAEAAAQLRETLQRATERLGATHSQTTVTRSTYGYAAGMSGDIKTGVAELERALADASSAPAPDFDLVAKTIERRIRLALFANDAERAEQLLDSYAAAVAGIAGADTRTWVGKVDTLRGEVLLARARPQDAREALQRAGLALAKGAGGDAVVAADQRLLLASAYAAAHDPDSARTTANEGRALLEKLPSPPARLTKLAEKLPR